LREGVDLLTSHELLILTDEPPPGCTDNAIEELATFQGIYDDLLNARTEVRALVAGRFGSAPRRGAPEKRRGREIAAELLGVAQAYGLKLTRNVEPDPATPLHSCADAVVQALSEIENQPPDPVAKKLLSEMPREWPAIVKLVEQSRKDTAAGKRLAARISEGRTRFERKLHEAKHRGEGT
jgi:hypothetical protein